MYLLLKMYEYSSLSEIEALLAEHYKFENELKTDHSHKLYFKNNINLTYKMSIQFKNI